MTQPDDELTLYVWDAGGSAVYDPLFLTIGNFHKTSQYPAGTYGAAAFFIAHDVLRQPMRLRGGHEVQVWDGGALIYHGWVESLEDTRYGAREGTQVSCVGPWGWIMERHGLVRNWADTRISGDVWDWLSSASGAEKATDNRDNRIRITPKGVAWSTNNDATIQYAMPTGENIGRITNNFDLQEGLQAWTLRLWNVDGSASIWSKTASATGSEANDLSPVSNSVWLQFIAGANQTPTEDGVYYGEIDNIVVYADKDHASRTLGNMNIYEIGLDIVDLLGVDETLISDDTSGLDSALTYSLVPFISNGQESYASQLARAAGFGDSSQNAIGFGLSSPLLSPDGKPRLFVEVYPDATDYDYEVSAEETGLSLRLNVDSVYNYITVSYNNIKGDRVIITPDDDANLKDTDSIDLYGHREPPELHLPVGGATAATNYGRRFLKRYKDPTYAVTRPLQVQRLRAKNGGYVPASQIDAGQRVRILDLPDAIDQGGHGGLTFLIVRTDYNHASRSASLSLGGPPDHLGIRMAQFALRAERLGR